MVFGDKGFTPELRFSGIKANLGFKMWKNKRRILEDVSRASELMIQDSRQRRVAVFFRKLTQVVLEDASRQSLTLTDELEEV